MHATLASGFVLALLGLALVAQEPAAPRPAAAPPASSGATDALAAHPLAPDPLADPLAAELAARFEREVRPILVNRCEECHADTADGGFRVDTREHLMQGGESGLAVVAGDPDASLLMQAVRHTHASLRMPKRRAKLAQAELDVLAQWIRDGAYWPDSAAAPGAAPASGKRSVESQRDFWSLRPLARPADPVLAQDAWPRGAIDRFVFARLEAAGLACVPPADRRTLIRRVTLGLTGLPPAPEEVEAFVADEDPRAYERLVERLLASPRYGEHWGRWWLDVARYAEDDCRSLDPQNRGFNPYPNAYLYRDWVVQALNDDLPYGAFVEAQLAADLLGERARPASLAALGFLGLGPWLYDNGSVEVTRADERHDRVDAVTRGFLGFTVACARCHDHKYDAISTEDYYALAGVFKNTEYREYPQVPKKLVEEHEAAQKELERKEKLLREFQQAESRQHAQSLALQTKRYMQAAWRVLGEKQQDKALVATEEELDYELFDRWLAFLAKPPKHYHYLVEWQAMIAARGKKEQAAKLAQEFQDVVLDVMFEQIEIEEENEIIRAKALPGTRPKKRAKLPNEFVTNDDFCPGCGLELKGLSGERKALCADLFERDLDGAIDFAQQDEPGKPALFVFRGHALERQLGAERRKVVQDLRDEVKKLRKKLGAKYPYVHGVGDVAACAPIRVHVRGSPFKLGAEVPARMPALLAAPDAAPFAQGSGRLELARAIVAHPLSARVLVNRVWKGHFGAGLVETASDFGETGERPSNPELLEYLAWSFVEGGGSLKALHREILLSATYQLSDGGAAHGASARVPDLERCAAQDPANRLHWRANVRRLSAEQLRDSVLFVSGALDTKLGGPSEKLTPHGKRRTLYGAVSRYQLDGFLALFDFPSPSATSERRFTTQVPLQRLFLMNSDFMQQQAELLAARVADKPGDEARIRELYRLLFARAPTEEETREGLAYLAAEPMQAYEERKLAREKELAEAKDEPHKKQAAPDGGKPDDAGEKEGEDGEEAKPEPGMMAGADGKGEERDAAKKPLPVTVLGRYAKVLLSSHEFLFVR